MEADIGKIGGDLQRCGEVGHVEDAETGAVAAEEVKHLTVEPGLVAKLENVSQAAGKYGEKGFQQTVIAV